MKATYKNKEKDDLVNSIINEMKIVQDLKEDNIIQYNRIYDCLVAMDAVQDNNPDQYNDVLNALIQKARDLTEEGLKELYNRNTK
jgi:hypothetical protein